MPVAVPSPAATAAASCAPVPAAVPAPDARPRRHFHARARDVDELAQAQVGWRLEYDQLSKGAFTGDVEQLRLPQMGLVMESVGRAVRQRGEMSRDEIGFAMGLRDTGPAYFHGLRLDAEDIMIGRGDELDLTLPDGHELVAIVVGEALLREIWQQLYGKPWSAWLDQKVVVRARPGMAAQVRSLHLQTMSSLREDTDGRLDDRAVLALRDAILVEWLEAIPAQVDTSDLKTSKARRRVVDRVCEIVLGQPDQPVTLLKVCQAVGASPRKLDYCFRDVLGMSPSRYLRAVRLNRVRRALKDAGETADTVFDVAARWGFWHMGTFSGDYKQQFGELPSATLRAARERAGRRA